MKHTICTTLRGDGLFFIRQCGVSNIMQSERATHAQHMRARNVDDEEVFVVKRDGTSVPLALGEITDRLKELAYDLPMVHPMAIAIKTVHGIYPGIRTAELDALAARHAAYEMSHPQYAQFGGRIAASNLQKLVRPRRFSDTCRLLYAHKNRLGEPMPLISDELLAVVSENEERIDGAIDASRDMQLDYFGFKTLERSYLLRVDGEVVETPQYMYMRTALGIYGRDVDEALACYDLLSRGKYTHASPTLFNAGTRNPQMSSCFLMAMKSDSIEGIFDTLKNCALISKHAGGLGLHVHNIRSTGAFIRGTNGRSNGIVPMLRIFNNMAKYVDQGGGKRPGALAVYIEPWHADVRDFIQLRKPTGGTEERRCRDLFLALWVPDLFMRRVEADGEWSLFCPSVAGDLADVYGAEFDARYEAYERQGLATTTVRAQTLWFDILDAQMESGTPFILYKDAANRKSNQKNVGVIKSSNLCTEIMEVSTPTETAVCNLASIALPKFVSTDSDGVVRFDMDDMMDVVRHAVRALNRVIDINHYPTPETRTSNMRHRPIGLGVQGLADVFMLFDCAFDAPEARALNRDIFEALYLAAVQESAALAEVHGAYESFQGSPASEGLLQFDLWDVAPSPARAEAWAQVKAKIAAHGLRNSLLVAPMPTASTAQILGNNEAFEPITSNVYVRRVSAGEFVVWNKHLVHKLQSMDLWTPSMRERIIAANGSVKDIDEIPPETREVFRTVWEIPQRSIIDMARDRGAFIDQSQSLNLHVADPCFQRITSMHFHAWKAGLKTGCYYTRIRPAADAIKFTLDTDITLSAHATTKTDETENKENIAPAAAPACSLANPDCLSCGS